MKSEKGNKEMTLGMINEKSNAKEYFNTLETLRDSGVINMFGATSYIQEEFGLNKVDARDVLFAWTHPAS